MVELRNWIIQMFSVSNGNTHYVNHFHCTRCKICRVCSAPILVKAAFSLFRKVGSRCTEEPSLLWQTKMRLSSSLPGVLSGVPHMLLCPSGGSGTERC